jgi:hypothetical protein
VENLVNPRHRGIFLTDDTGFENGWPSLWLGSHGAQFCGLAFELATEPNLRKGYPVGS